ncbi:MAG: hypothetical protein A3D65_05165 [Candidatus Lloydbacteria bacterium RIFCSPHIGHO2_02_FULL_50_13]|uniref:Phosphoglycerate mutase n=1 Tax=Candidatus Lloydbacteria bacterium RIFCSPHIGHO2_02_FULL_50_13 TaxID=1798661 RepID=A0A1G2D0L0_9BACT|nr:MAG: hypothetical protein A3D65_05165 [Candidatus Lloydbacteria bacterium RIFCSPHIGHO2_02_FULL_50_13]
MTNATKINYGPTVPLTDRGKAQARIVGKRLASLMPKRLIASPYERAKETGSTIAEEVGLPLEHSDLFIERRAPSVVRNRHGEEPEVQRIWKAIAENADIPDWHHSDEENFSDLRGRAKVALCFLETIPEDPTIVVTHGLFMKMLLAHILLGAKLDGRIFWDCFVPAKNIANTGIMHLEYTENFHKTGMYWKLVSWNDHAHLSPDLL